VGSRAMVCTWGLGGGGGGDSRALAGCAQLIAAHALSYAVLCLWLFVQVRGLW
jgi:hypothetical protein